MCLKVIYECFSASAAGKENFVKKKKKKLWTAYGIWITDFTEL